MTNKHAYLIMAHHQWDLLKILIELIDDERNDIYIHFDKKADNIPYDEILQTPSKARIFATERIDVRLGSFSFCEAELLLLHTALRNGSYRYLHLLSGCDLPVKSQNELHDFFNENYPCNYVDITNNEIDYADFSNRYKYYHIFNPYRGRRLFKLDLALCACQKILGIDRTKELKRNGLNLAYGSNWFSITSDLAQYILSNRDLLVSLFGRFVSIPDELFIQTLVDSSPYRQTIFDNPNEDTNVRGNLRYIAWSGNASPETITMDMMKQLTGSQALFARKIDLGVDSEIVQYIKESIGCKR